MNASMRKAATAMTVVASAMSFVAVAAPSDATTPPQTETDSQTYYLAAYETGSSTLNTINVGGADFTVPTWARYYSVIVADASGLPTAGDLWTDPHYPSELTDVGTFCGRTTHSFSVDPTEVKDVWVTLNQGPCSDGTLAAGTLGTISVTFSS